MTRLQEYLSEGSIWLYLWPMLWLAGCSGQEADEAKGRSLSLVAVQEANKQPYGIGLRLAEAQSLGGD